MPADLGFTTFGDGPARVLVLHDWFCDHTGWDATLPYLTTAAYRYVFADLRGYGKSRGIEGHCTVDEAAGDALALAGRLGWTRFSLVGHSMSGLIVQRMAQLAPDRIARVAAICPVPPTGGRLDAAALDFFRSLALADDERRFAVLRTLWGDRLSETWLRYKLRRWRETASPEAVAKYVDLWGSTDISQGARGVATPMLVVAGAQDAPPLQPGALSESLLPWYPNARLIPFGDSGHYPMQEEPPLLATVVERFLGEQR